MSIPEDPVPEVITSAFKVSEGGMLVSSSTNGGGQEERRKFPSAIIPTIFGGVGFLLSGQAWVHRNRSINASDPEFELRS